MTSTGVNTGMARNDEGEFELVLGNRQLLSFFFLVVVLLGVFFTMGYIVGRNSGPVSSEVVGGPVTGARVGPREPVRIEPANSPMPEVPAEKVEAPKPEVKLEAAKVEAPKVEAAKPEAAKVEPPVRVEAAKAGQSYLQVAAVARADADRMANGLKGQQMPASVVPGPNESIFRVVVGPLADEAAAKAMRDRLEAAGFKPILKRF